MFQGQDARGRDGMEIDFPLDDVQALILTHVHIDHIGRIPYLLEAGFNKPIYCTKPTAKLLPIMLEDAMRLGITRNRRVIKEFLEEPDSPCAQAEGLSAMGRARARPPRQAWRQASDRAHRAR